MDIVVATPAPDHSAARHAIEKLRVFFAEQATRQGLLARRLLRCDAVGDEPLREYLVERLHAEVRPDGSVQGGMVPTAWRAQELMDLGIEPRRGPASRMIRWMLGLARLPGAFGEGCTPERHAQRVCEHYIEGFFAVAPPTERVAPVTLPNGKVFRSEPAARFAISCLALRTVLRTGQQIGSTVAAHLSSLARLNDRFTAWNGYFAPDLMVAALHALACAGSEYSTSVARSAAFVAQHQDENGTWPQADLFNVLEALLAAGTAEARGAVQRALPALLALQRADGSFGGMAREERALIGLTALLWTGR